MMHGVLYTNSRLDDWLAGLPNPVSPQERYLQGLDPRVDHPLHPHPLKSVRAYQKLKSQVNEITPIPQTPQLEIEDQENDTTETRQSVMFDTGNSVIVCNKRTHSQETPEGERPSKRAKLMGPIRRLSIRVSSALSSRPEDNETQPKRRRHSMFAALVATDMESFAQAASTKARNRASALFPSTAPVTPVVASLGSHVSDRADIRFNVIFIGDAEVGKSAAIKRFTNAGFSPEYEPSGLDYHTIRANHGGLKVTVDVYDGGSVRFPNQPHYLAMNWYHVIIVCMDIGNPASLESLGRHRREVGAFEENPVVIIAGLKKDRRRTHPTLRLNFLEEPLPVSIEQANTTAVDLNCQKYLECSAKTGEGVNELFEYIIQSGVQKTIANEKLSARLRAQRRTVGRLGHKVGEKIRNFSSGFTTKK